MYFFFFYGRTENCLEMGKNNAGQQFQDFSQIQWLVWEHLSSFQMPPGPMLPQSFWSLSLFSDHVFQ